METSLVAQGSGLMYHGRKEGVLLEGVVAWFRVKVGGLLVNCVTQ
jgi:hypothetical protein